MRLFEKHFDLVSYFWGSLGSLFFFFLPPFAFFVVGAPPFPLLPWGGDETGALRFRANWKVEKIEIIICSKGL